MRIPSLLLPMLVFGLASIARADAPSTQPAATQPSTGTIRGRVSIGGGFDFQKPDLARVVVYLASDPVLDAMPIPAERPQVTQQHKTFVPNFVAIPRGTWVEFPNLDHFDHNVFSRSKAAPAFDLDRYPYGQSKSRQFDKVGVVQVFCNIHPYMRAMIVVTPNTFFARADSEGRFEIRDVPPGQYDLITWHERCGDQHHSIRVVPGETPEVSLVLEQNRAAIVANDPPEHRGGYGVERGLGVKRERLDLPVVKDAHPAPPPEKQP